MGLAGRIDGRHDGRRHHPDAALGTSEWAELWGSGEGVVCCLLFAFFDCVVITIV